MAANGQIVKKMNLTRTNLSKHYLNSESADIFFKCSGGPKVEEAEMSVPAHTIVLASVSSVFHAMFYGQMAEKSTVEMTDVTVGGLKEFLRPFYTDKLLCTPDHVHEILYLAEKYDVPESLWVCSKFLMQHGHQVFKTTNFLCCPQIVVRNLLQNTYLKGDGEILFRACIDWAENACRSLNMGCEIENIRQVLGNCLSSIEFASVKQSTAISCIGKYRCLLDELTLGHILQLICEKLTGSTEYNAKINWPIVMHILSGQSYFTMKEGQSYRMSFETHGRFLLHGIGFYFPSDTDDKIHLLVSIEKVNPKNQEKMKIFVGRLLLQDKFEQEEGFLLSTSLPDIMAIQANMNYVIEVTPFEDVTMLQYGIEYSYSLVDSDIPFSFSNEKCAVLQITKM